MLFTFINENKIISSSDARDPLLMFEKIILLNKKLGVKATNCKNI